MFRFKCESRAFVALVLLSTRADAESIFSRYEYHSKDIRGTKEMLVMASGHHNRAVMAMALRVGVSADAEAELDCPCCQLGWLSEAPV